MKKNLILIIPLIILGSCATITNRKTQRIDIITNTPASVKINDEILLNVNNRTKIIALRDVRPVKFSVFNETISKELILDSRNSFPYWFNIYANAGLGMLIDKDSPKRYAYPKRVYVDMTNDSDSYTLYNPMIRKGSLQLHYSFPWVNNFLLKPAGEHNTKFNTGFWGAMLGLDYYRKTNQYFNLSISGVMDFFIPFPAAVDFSGEYDTMSSLSLNFSYNYRIRRNSVGYGISFSKNTWDHHYSDWLNPPPPVRDPVSKSDYSIGFIFPLYIQAGERFNIGLLYRPSFLTIKPAVEFKYEHLISIDFAWKIHLIK